MITGNYLYTMYRQVNDFLAEWKYETESTLKLFSLIDEHRFHEQVHPNVRSCSRLAFHITHTIGEMMERTGLKIDGYHEEVDLFWTKKELIDAYRQWAESCAEQVKKNWTDADLEKKDNMYGEEWRKGETLSVLIRHQSHHRGELVIMMRILGMKVAGMYGPASEEWVEMGMAPLE